MVTALELLAGLADVQPQKFHQLKEQIDLACQLSKGRILEEPRFLLCKEVLHVPFPPTLVRPPVKTLSLYMEVIRRAESLQEILEERVRFRLRNSRAGFKNTSVLKDLLAGPKREWIERSEQFATEIYPDWRQHFEKTGKRLPAEMCKGIESRLASEIERTKFIETFLEWLGADTGPQSVAEITTRLDAVLQLTDFVAREFLTRNYNLEKHESDVYDQFQLYYLAMDRFVIVSEDRDFRMRTARSTQAGRIMSFEQFLGTLP